MRLALSVLALVLCSCSTTVGPVVRDVQLAPDGSTIVDRCSLRMTTLPFLVAVIAPKLSYRDCAIGPLTPAPKP
jgi:hypothetical protein